MKLGVGYKLIAWIAFPTHSADREFAYFLNNVCDEIDA